MTLLPQEIIRKKRLGLELTSDDTKAFFGGYLAGLVADYQVAAMLMAILLKGMTDQEAANLTLFMRDSGDVLKWPGLPVTSVCDKHSTGGVGDKTSLILLPLCILEGLYVPMIAGRGLGHTGGTLDKLESIPGTRVFLDPAETKRLMQVHHGFFMGQTSSVAPLDKRLYAMRDVTDTVESIPLITASILSKKLSEGIGGLVMDVKFGSGAFMREASDAQRLAESISRVATAAGVNVTCLLTDMNSPLGDRAGNILEVQECIEIFHGKGPSSTIDLTLCLTIEMLKLAGRKESDDILEKKLRDHLTSGRAFELFCRLIQDQGGDTSYLVNPSKFKAARHVVDVYPKDGGFISDIDSRKIGLAIIKLGGGRVVATDVIKSEVGFSDLKRVGDFVGPKDLLCRIHADDKDVARVVQAEILEAYRFSSNRVSPESLILKRITGPASH